MQNIIVKENREYIKIVRETLLLTATQNMREHIKKRKVRIKDIFPQSKET